MSGVACEQMILPGLEPCFRIKMNAPRSNALEPGLLSELRGAFDAIEWSGVTKVLLSSGRNFSTGGDVGRFYEAAQNGNAEQYAKSVVPALQDLVLRMLSMPVIIAVSIRGAVTGGAAGLVFGSDLATAAPDAFMQPYYSAVGFAPDGGWTAVLPKLIGTGHARGWLMSNHRYDAAKLHELGLVQAVDSDPDAQALTLLDQLDVGSALATKSLLWNARTLAEVQQGLGAETSAFENLIGRPETLSRMERFLQTAG
ncbi:MAG: enoyl-CoA hydratase/isomerase family protein [Pseudomonadota bacterium]|nr:enoyl-CoA hydratase/isomerase family protein [Pseudomonadota bacterium]